MLRPIYSKFNEIVNCSGVATGQVNIDREAQMILRNQQDVFVKFTKFQMLLDQLLQLEQQTQVQQRPHMGGTSINFHQPSSHIPQSRSSQGFKQLQQVYQGKSQATVDYQNQGQHLRSGILCGPNAMLPDITKNLDAHSTAHNKIMQLQAYQSASLTSVQPSQRLIVNSSMHQPPLTTSTSRPNT